MLTAETTLPPVQPTSSPYSRTPDTQHVPPPPQTPNSSLCPGCASSQQHPLHSSQPYPSSRASIHSLTPETAVSSCSSHRAGVTHGSSSCHCDAQADTLQRHSGDTDVDIQPSIRASSSRVLRHTVDGSLPLVRMHGRHASEDLLRRQSASLSAILPTRQQQLAAICRLRKPLAVVTQKNSLIRYTGDGRRYWRWKDVVARVLHICRGASADDYSLLLQTEHWLEACDSKHRYGSNLKPYFKVWLESETHQSFFKWLDEGQGLNVDIQERPRSKLDADRVVYCGIERCFFEVTVVQGWFRYRISKRLVTTDSSRDQPPCPPNLGETMDSIRNRMMSPPRIHSPLLVGPNAACCSTPPLSPGDSAVPLVAMQLGDSAHDHEAAHDCMVGQYRAAAQQGDAAQGSLSDQKRTADSYAEECADEARASVLDMHTTSHAELIQGAPVSGPPVSMPPTVCTGRLSADGGSVGPVLARRPGLLTQEFNRAAGMPYAQGGDSMRGHDMVRTDVKPSESLRPLISPFSSSPPSAACEPQHVLPRISQITSQLASSRSGSVLAGHNPSDSQGKKCDEPGSDCVYPYHTDDRYAGGWLSDNGQLCMRRHGINSMPSGLLHFPSLVSPSSRLYSRDVGGSDDEDSSSLPYGRSLGGSSVDASGESSPACSSPRPAQSGSVLPARRRKPMISSALLPHTSIHGFPSMPRLGVTSSTQPPLLRPPQRTLRFPASSTTPEPTNSTPDDSIVSLQPCTSQRQWHLPLQRNYRSAEMPDVFSESGEENAPACAPLRSAGEGTAAQDAKKAVPQVQCKGWEILRESLRMRKLPQPISRSASTAASAARKHAQRRIRAPLDSHVADVAHPRLVSNSAIPENLKLLDIVETVAAPGGPCQSFRVSQACNREPGNGGGAGNKRELAAGSGADTGVRDLADMLEERMVNTGQLVKVKTQAQLEQMLPCAPKVLSKDSCASQKGGLPGRKCQMMVPVHEHASDCNSVAFDRPCELMPPQRSQSDCSSSSQDMATLPAPNLRRDGEGTDAAQPCLLCEPPVVPHVQLASAQDGTAVLEKAREKWIYVWDMHSRLYINRKMPGRFHHSSFVAGGAVKAAGSIVVEDGVLKQLTTWSGHYRPRASDIALFLQWLESNHVDMTNVELLLVKPNKPNSKMNKPS